MASEIMFRLRAGRWAFYLGLTLLLPACHATPLLGTSVPALAPTSTRSPDTHGPQVAERSFPIHYENRGKPTKLPLLHATIAGRATSMLLDSGATTHVIADWLARDLRLSLEASERDEAVDHEGRRISMLRAKGVPVALETWGALEVPSFLVTQMPAVFEREDVGGIISPQQLVQHGDEVLVIDLKKGHAVLEPTLEAEAHLDADRGCALTVAAVPACADARLDGADAPLFAIPSMVENHPTRMLVDTGSIRTDVIANSSAAKSARTLDAGNAAFALSGASEYRILPNAQVRAGECEFARDVDVIEGAPGTTCAREGVLGIDVLRSCVLVVDRARIRGRCSE